MRSSCDGRPERLRLAASRLATLIAASRRQPAWFGAAVGLALFYVALLAVMKGLSGNAAEIFFDELPARAAANASPVELPLCIDFTAASLREDPRLFGLGAFESWGAPGRWTIGAVAGLAAKVPDDGDDLSLRVRGEALLGEGRPQVAYQLAVNGKLFEQRTLTQANPQMDISVVIPAALVAQRPALLVELRTPNIRSARDSGLSGDWRKLGISISTIRLFRAHGAACPSGEQQE